MQDFAGTQSTSRHVLRPEPQDPHQDPSSAHSYLRRWDRGCALRLQQLSWRRPGLFGIHRGDGHAEINMAIASQRLVAVTYDAYQVYLHQSGSPELARAAEDYKASKV